MIIDPRPRRKFKLYCNHHISMCLSGCFAPAPKTDSQQMTDDDDGTHSQKEHNNSKRVFTFRSLRRTTPLFQVTRSAQYRVSGQPLPAY